MNVGVEVEIKITASPDWPALPYGTSVYRYDTPCCTVSETCNFEKALLRWGGGVSRCNCCRVTERMRYGTGHAASINCPTSLHQ